MKTCFMFLGFSIILLLAACSDNNKNTEDDQKTSEGLTELTIGLLLPLSGEQEEAGIQVYNGVNMAVEELNESGGVNGYRFRVVAYNNESNPDQSILLYNQLRTEIDLVAVICGLLPGETLAIQPIAEQDGIALITLDSFDVDLTSDHANVFRIVLTEEQRHQMALRYILEGIEADHLAILFNFQDSVSVTMKDAFREYLNENNILNSTYDISASSNYYSTYINSIKFRSCDAIISPGSQSYASSFIAQARAEDLNIPFIVVDAWNYQVTPYELMRILEDYHEANDTPLHTDFVNRYHNQFEEKPSTMSALGYDAIKIIAAAVSNWNGGDFTTNLLKDATLTSSISGLIGFDENGYARKKMLVVEYESGDATVVDAFE